MSAEQIAAQLTADDRRMLPRRRCEQASDRLLHEAGQVAAGGAA